MTDFNIQQNPTEIVIRRKESVRSGGGRAETETVLDPQTVRIYSVSSNAPEVEITEPGVKHKTVNVSMLAPYTADVKASSTVSDEFEWQGGKYKVKDCKPMIQNDQVVGYQCRLERVN